MWLESCSLESDLGLEEREGENIYRIHSNTNINCRVGHAVIVMCDRQGESHRRDLKISKDVQDIKW